MKLLEEKVENWGELMIAQSLRALGHGHIIWCLTDINVSSTALGPVLCHLRKRSITTYMSFLPCHISVRWTPSLTSFCKYQHSGLERLSEGPRSHRC